MNEAADVLTAHFEALIDRLAGVDLIAVEEACRALLITIESLDKGLGVLPDAIPDFTNYTTPRDLADAARHRIEVMDAHLIQHQRAHTAIGELLTAFEQAHEAGFAAEQLVREIDRMILNLEGVPQ